MSETITLKKENVRKAIDEANGEVKKALENLFADHIRPKDIKERIKTFEDACAELGVKPEDYLVNNHPDAKGLNALAKLTIISKALNEEWEPDWSNENEYKYYPYFKFKKGKLAFSYSDCYYWRTLTLVCSRLSYKSPELAIYAGEQFADIYNDFLLMK